MEHLGIYCNSDAIEIDAFCGSALPEIEEYVHVVRLETGSTADTLVLLAGSGTEVREVRVSRCGQVFPSQESLGCWAHSTSTRTRMHFTPIFNI